MKLKVTCLIDFDPCEMGGYEFNEFIERRQQAFQELIAERFEIIAEPAVKIEIVD